MAQEIRIKWHGHLSKPRLMPGSSAMGSHIGNLEFDSKTSHNADLVPKDDRFEFVDDLSCLEIINKGVASQKWKQQVSNDIPTHGQIISNTSLKSQKYIEVINTSTTNQQMLILEKKTKAMIINFTHNYQFNTRMKLNDQNIEIVPKMKILGTTITENFSWDENCSSIIKSECKNAITPKYGVLVQTLKTWSIFRRCIVS